MTSMTKTHIQPIIFVLIALVCIGLSACKDDIFSTSPTDKLSFSTDTLTFDTVFTKLGSTTAKILVYNRNKTALKIANISVIGGKNSAFRINVDGVVNANNQFKNLEIRANDSMYIFVALTVNPVSEDSPVIIQDSLEFITNGVKQQIQLLAYGQNVVRLTNKLIKNDSTLTNKLPYVITGYLAVDTSKTLTIEPGTKLYFHNNANLIVYGNLKAEGTANQPILMRGDRLDKIKFTDPVPYNLVAGQWGGVYLLWKGGNHSLKHVNMNSGYVGIYFSNEDRNATLPNLEISNCKIHNFLLYGLLAQNGNLTVTNTEISNTSSYSLYLNGGKHKFIQSTIANYFNSGIQPLARDKKPAVLIMNLNKSAPMETVFQNCVISGSAENEFGLASKFLDLYNGTFDHCYIKNQKNNLAQFKNIRWSEPKDTVFKNITYNQQKGLNYNFSLDSVSPARGLADPAIVTKYHLEHDLNGNLRDDKPDAGAYEWVPTK